MEPEKKTVLVLLLLLMAPLAGIGIDLFVPSLPAIANDLGTQEHTVKFSIVLYLVGYALGQPFFGTLSDVYGRKKPLLIGLILYILISTLIAFSPSIEVMLILRVLQGASVAAPGVLSKAILSDTFSSERLAKLSSSMALTWAIGPIIAPVIGGYLETYLGWQSCFYFFALYGLALLLVCLFFLKETNGNQLPFNMSRLLQIYREACFHKIFLGAILCLSIVYSLAVVFNVAAPFLVETVLGYSPIVYGHSALFMGLGFFIGSLANRLLLRSFTVDQLLPIAILYGCVVAALMVVFALLFGVHLITLIFFTFFLLIASGSVFPNSMSKALSLFPKTAGTATAIMGSVYMIGTSLITVVASFLETKTLIPISICYLALMCACLFTYIFIIRSKLN